MAWPSNDKHQVPPRRLTATLALCAVLTCCACGSALATPNNSTNKGRLESTVRFLQNAQNQDGGFGGNLGGESNQDFSAWVTFALAADSINPQDQATTNGGVDAYTYLTTHVARALHEELCRPVICTTSLERELLVADAAGTSPHDYGGIDLSAELLARKLADGSFPFVPGGHGEINDTIYAILSLSLVAGTCGTKRGRGRH